MHDTAIDYAEHFNNCYVEKDKVVIDIGGRNVNGSFKDIFKNYFTLDFVEGEGVDMLMTDPYTIPLNDNSQDVIICSSCFEHSELFWVLFLEIMRVLKPTGLFYLNVPSNGDFHRWPVDCWRFYPDSGNALVTWAKRNGLNVALLESFVGKQKQDIWNDFVAVFVKDEQFAPNYPIRIINQISEFNNGLMYGSSDFINYDTIPQDRK
jgi:SAM-dependent methyltransferase